MSEYSELMGSFIRVGNFPLEANYIFETEAALKEFYSIPENQVVLHEGVLKVVLNSGELSLYWVVRNLTSGELEFKKLISVGTSENLETTLQDLSSKLEQEIKDRTLADDAIYGSQDHTIVPSDLNTLIKIAEAIKELQGLLATILENKDDIKAVVGTEQDNIKEYLQTLDYKSLTELSLTLNKFLNTFDPDDNKINTFPELQKFLGDITDNQTIQDLLNNLVGDVYGDPLPSEEFRTLRNIEDFVRVFKSDSENRDDNLQSEIDQTQVGVGLSGDGAYNADLETYYLKNATSVMNALKILDSLINEAINNCNLQVLNTETVNLALQKSTTLTTLSADVKISSQLGNGLLAKRDGLFYKLTTDYSLGILTVRVNDAIISQHNLGLSAIVSDARYDPTLEALMIVFELHDGEKQILSIPVGSLIREWIVDNSDSTKVVELTKLDVLGGGPDKLSADVRLYTDRYLILEKKGNTLYVKGTTDNLVHNNNKLNEVIDSIQSTSSDLSNKLLQEIDRSTSADEQFNIDLTSHIQNFKNPHLVTKDLIGLGSVDNTSDMDKPVSTATLLIINTLSDKVSTLEASLNTSIKLHIEDLNNPHKVTSLQVGLGNVTNDAQVKRDEMGVAEGVATLDKNGKIPVELLPGLVDEVFGIDHFVSTKTDIPSHLVIGDTYYVEDQGIIFTAISDIQLDEGVVPEKGVIYSNRETNSIYRWDGKELIELGNPIHLGETSDTAYPGNKGKDTTDKLNSHLSDYNNPHKVTKDLIGLDKVMNLAPMDMPISTATKDALNSKADIEIVELKLSEKAPIESPVFKGIPLVENSPELGDNSNRIATTNWVTLTIENTVDSDLGNHITDYNNPHRVTAELVGSYTKEYIDDALSNKANLVDGKIPLDELPNTVTSSVHYGGNWDASTNSPNLIPSDPSLNGVYYIVTTDGTFNGLDFKLGDLIINAGGEWIKIDNSDLVTSVNGKIGDVIITIEDIENLQNLLDSKADFENVYTKEEVKDLILNFQTSTGENLDELTDLILEINNNISNLELDITNLDVSKADLIDGVVPENLLPDSIKGCVKYKGDWDASNNNPALSNLDIGKEGWYYIVSEAGRQFSSNFKVGDWVVNSGGRWTKVNNADAVSSVNGHTGEVTINIEDIPGLSDAIDLGGTGLEDHITDYNNPHRVTKELIGLDKVLNYSPQEMPISNEVLNALTLINTTISELETDLTSHIRDYNNPHKVTRAQVGLDRVDNTSDLEKPISVYTQNALNEIKLEMTDLATTDDLSNHINNYNNPHRVTADQVGLGRVDNTSDLDKPISNATQHALDEKADIHHTHTMIDIEDLETPPIISGFVDSLIELPELATGGTKYIISTLVGSGSTRYTLVEFDGATGTWKLKLLTTGNVACVINGDIYKLTSSGPERVLDAADYKYFYDKIWSETLNLVLSIEWDESTDTQIRLKVTTKTAYAAPNTNEATLPSVTPKITYINIEKERFLSSAYSRPATLEDVNQGYASKIGVPVLVVEFTTGNEAVIDLSDTLNIYDPVDTSTVDMSVSDWTGDPSTSYKISANVRIAENNDAVKIVDSNNNGIYARLDKKNTNSIQLVDDGSLSANLIIDNAVNNVSDIALTIGTSGLSAKFVWGEYD